ncbi:MAG: collagen binding domain-containing protein [Ruminococcus sp.]
MSDGNPNYSLAGAQYGVFHGESQVATLTTNEQGYAKVDNLEILDEGDSYTIRELSASPGFAIDVESHKVSVTPEGTATVKVKEIPQNQPLDLLLQKLDADLNEAKPQGSGSLSGAEFTIKFYTEQMDTDPATI